MRNLLMAGVAISSLVGHVARADTSTNDRVFADAALRALHNMARATAQSEQAAKDADDIGCQGAYEDLQKAAHEALTNMHYMSFAPIDSINNVSILLRLSHLTPNGCSDKVTTDTNILPIVAGQAIMSLRYDYAIGDGNWYMIDVSGEVEAKNPLRYARSLKDQNYSWVSVRPKGMIFMVESDWKTEMASHEVDDPSIENSGNNLRAVEIDHRKNPDDGATVVYFYRTKADALAVAQADAEANAELNASNAAEKGSDAEWSQKLTSLPYMVADHREGFKLVYSVCKPTTNGCKDDGSHDWSESRNAPYHWFSDRQGCEKAQVSIHARHPPDVKVEGNEVFGSFCVPAPKMSGHALAGYEMVFALSAPGAESGDEAFADLRESGSRTATVFQTFKACYTAMDSADFKIMKDLGVDEDGTLLSDKTKSISVMATCVRVYSP